MDIPLELAFHNLTPPPGLEDEIRERVGKLERHYSHLIGCRVSVEALHKQHRAGNLFGVHIELRVPGREIVVSREPHHVRERYASPRLRTLLRDAFKEAANRLTDFKEVQRGFVKTHAAPFQGRVSELHPDRDHGFILTNEGMQLYFHRNSVMDGGFAALKLGDPVRFVEAMGDTGPTASKVWGAAAAASAGGGTGEGYQP